MRTTTLLLAACCLAISACGPAGGPALGTGTVPVAPNTAFGSAPLTSGPNGGPGVQEGSGASTNR